MHDLESPTDDDLEEERQLLAEAKQALGEAFLAYLDGHDPHDCALVARFEEGLKPCTDLQELTMASSVFCMEEGLEFDPLDALRKQGILEEETEGVIQAAGTIGTDENPEEVALERAKRMAILVKYKPLVSDQFIEERLTINFLGEGSLELLIYQGVVWELAEAQMKEIQGQLEQGYMRATGKGSVPQKNRRELKQQAEEEAIRRVKARLKTHGIVEPQA